MPGRSSTKAAHSGVREGFLFGAAILLLTSCGETAERANKNYVEGARKAAGATPATPAAPAGPDHAAAPAQQVPPADQAGEKAGEKAPDKAGGGGAGGAGMIALGDSIFHGQVAGGTCTACHGPDATGTAVGPNLTDQEWLNVDGSQAAIAGVVQKGVPTPKKYPAPMPPMGGGQLTPDQVQAVAAYVHSLSGKT